MSVHGVAKALVGGVIVATLSVTGATAASAQVSDVVVSIPADSQDVANLRMMFEEERMAQDLYVALGEKWGSRKFSNISKAETKHNGLVAAQLDRLGVARPDASVAGKYENADIQKLYDDWLARGLESQDAAFKVGAELERRDIADLEKVMAETEDQVLKDVYGRLLAGSKNHLAAFEAGAGQKSGQGKQGRQGRHYDGGGNGWRGGRG
ncbi:hypothetical protein CKALI_09980 [Corynebacterium kalinowskii]|uniref:DUF2202 domain-containing protein n=1 Tax=Corynebacterium kalinowskii TaxID=2675216 RepID=A0A6B8VSH7_9CORY|nr:DUF2202 domain-containing protein [Corynebacterium kalinowskii]QGU02851.1 hypothetical protein CKALI_09980 [Corynebacterium kalinowskii]